MPGKNDVELFNYLLTQKSIGHKTPYDVLEQVIQRSIQSVKDNAINARISNLVLNIDNKLVLAQVYVERQNGFAPTTEKNFGTTPTAYKVQIRFPFGLETVLNGQLLFIPTGDFKEALEPYASQEKVSDDVQRDYKVSDIVYGPGVKRTTRKSSVIFSCDPQGHQVQFDTKETMGAGYRRIRDKIVEYPRLEDYYRRDKIGIRSLFDRSKRQPHDRLLRQYPYLGYTEFQGDQGQGNMIEPKTDGQAPARIDAYQRYLDAFNTALMATDAGKYWEQCSKQPTDGDYVFNISIVNGITLFSDSGLPVIRLRDYQLELFNQCLSFIDQVQEVNQRGLNPRLTSKIDMGVGAGKTFFIFTLLQHLIHQIQQNGAHLTPPFCLAPDEAVAQVTQKSIHRQGVVTGISAIAISSKSQMPDYTFMRQYQALSAQAAKDAEDIEAYLKEGLQAQILNQCKAQGLHPNKLINLMGNMFRDVELTTRLSTFKDSIDVKRLLLLVEGQKTIKEKTGMLGISALNNLLEQFEAIKAGIEAGLATQLIFKDSQEEIGALPDLAIQYNQVVTLPASMAKEFTQGVNMAELTPAILIRLLEAKHKKNRRAIRDDLMKIACLADNTAATLMANSGGLGNTCTPQEIEDQIKGFLPHAVTEIKTMAEHAKLTPAQHYTMYLYLNTVFSTIPDIINLKAQLGEGGVAAFQKQLYIQGLKDNLQLVEFVRQNLIAKKEALATVNGDDLGTLQSFDIKPNTTVIEAAHQLAGIASMRITGHATDDNAKLLLTHIPVFTPEGLVAYVEQLADLLGKSHLSFKACHGIYTIEERHGQVSKKDIQERLVQFLSALMIADEIHKEEFAFLYDEGHPLYCRISVITESYLGKTFKECLPHRMGMSGTMNDVADKAFGPTTLYRLSTQKMMQQGLMKKVSIDTHPIQPEIAAYAKQVVIDYFTHPSSISLQHVLKKGDVAVDLSSVSKGIIFSKRNNPLLNEAIIFYFNLLIKDYLMENDLRSQEELFAKINEKRKERIKVLQDKLEGKIELTALEIAQINCHNLSATTPIRLENNRIVGALVQQISLQNLELHSLKKIQLQALQNHLFSIYMEYILSKSSAPKEYSDIIGLQNKLFEKGVHLFQLNTCRDNEEAVDTVALMNHVDPKSITEEDVTRFVQERIKNKGQQTALCKYIMLHRNNHVAFVKALQTMSENTELHQWITQSRDEFEAGLAMAMIGSARERTGYSHEPIGMVMDVPSNLKAHANLDQSLTQIETLTPADMPGLLEALQTVVDDILSYDEKNQAGGRALRTPYGHVKYVEYQTTLNPFIEQFKDHPAMRALKVETSFQSIFTTDEFKAQEERESITFNREAIRMLAEEFPSIQDYYKAVRARFANKMGIEATKLQLEQYIAQRLPLLWSLKYQPMNAHAYFVNQEVAVFEAIRELAEQPVIVSVDDPSVANGDKETVHQAPDNPKPKKATEYSVIDRAAFDPPPATNGDKEAVHQVPENPKPKEATKYLVIDRATFDALLNALKLKTDELIEKGTRTSKHYNPKYVDVGQAAQTLYTQLKTAANDFFPNQPTQEQVDLFKHTCMKAITTAEDKFGTHRGWGSIHPILRGIVGVLATLLIIPALVIKFKTKPGYTGTFFTKPPTDSADQLDGFKKGFGRLIG